MIVHLVAVGERMPGWVQTGYAEFAKRLNADCRLNLIEVAAGRRGKNADIRRILREEGARMLAAVPKGARILALDVAGQAWSTERLAENLGAWMQDGRDLALLVGGAEGFDPDCLRQAEQRWSLSPLTFPHPLVRVIVAEQIYRAWSLLKGHPYHRA